MKTLSILATLAFISAPAFANDQAAAPAAGETKMESTSKTTEAQSADGAKKVEHTSKKKEHKKKAH